MFEMGLVVALGLLFTLAKLSWKTRIKILSHPLLADLLVFVALLVIHWGTFSGVMVATVGALVCSVVFAACRFLVGYIEDSEYIPGWFNVYHKM